MAVAPTMEPQWHRARSPDALAAWQRVLRPVAAGLARDSGEVAEALERRVTAALPELREEPDALALLRAGAEAGARAFAELVQRGDDPARMVLPPQTVAWARDAVGRGVPVTTLLHVYRVSVAEAWVILGRRIAAQASTIEELAEASALGSAWLLDYTDAAQTLATACYVEERDRWVRSTAASRAQTVDAILAGEQVDQVVAGRRLGYDLGREHLGVVAWTDAGDPGPAHRLEAAVATVARSAGAETTLLVARGALVAAAWLSRRSPFEAALHDRVRLGAVEPHVRVAIGEPSAGLPGFRQTHEEARLARGVATALGRPPGSVTWYRRVAVTALATADPRQARVFVDRALGGLAAADDTSRRLAATLSIYLDERCSRARTARRLGIHENTVRYRIAQAERVLGRPVSERALELRVALAIAGAVGAP